MKYSISLLILLAIIYFFFKRANRISNSMNAVKQNTTFNNNENKNFSKKEYLLTQNELKFYKLLKQITDKMELTIFSQVVMYEIVNCSNYSEFNKIRSKSIDFVITDSSSKIQLCIELDDTTHNQQKRIERDKTISEIFEKAGVNFLRISVQNFYNLQELENRIKQAILCDTYIKNNKEDI